MSIYYVKLNKWFPKGKDGHDTCKSIVSYFTCMNCGEKPRYRDVVGLHSVPWGYGCDELFCTWKCKDLYYEKKYGPKA